MTEVRSRVFPVCWLGLALLYAPSAAQTVDVVHLKRLSVDVPAGQTLAAVRDDRTGSKLPVQISPGGQYVCLVGVADGREPELTPIFADAAGEANSALFPPATRQGVEIRQADGVLDVRVRGEPFTQYHYRETPKPYFFPALGPGGVAMTRAFPMRDDVADEEHDHPHQRSLWFAFGDVNGIDFWTEGGRTGKIRHVRFGNVVSGPVFGSFTAMNEWTAADGTVVCTDERVFTVYALSDARLFDYTITLRATNGPLKLGDTKEGMMAMRLTPALRLKGKVAAGHVLTSTGLRDGQAWGKRAAWVDYSGPVAGHTVGATMFDHPSNLRHPTWWHARDYGLFAANPFGIHDFEGKPAGAGDHELKPGGQITFRYRIYLHAGDAEQAHVDEMFRAWTAE